MYRKREREFQYPPGIEKIIEDVIGGGTIDRRDLQNALFNGKALDEQRRFWKLLLPMRQRIRWLRTICSVWVTS